MGKEEQENLLGAKTLWRNSTRRKVLVSSIVIGPEKWKMSPENEESRGTHNQEKHWKTHRGAGKGKLCQ